MIFQVIFIQFSKWATTGAGRFTAQFGGSAAENVFVVQDPIEESPPSIPNPLIHVPKMLRKLLLVLNEAILKLAFSLK